jgi:3-oxoacyl-[acyl-carrier protein] reductase
MLENFEVGSPEQKRHVIPAWVSCTPEHVADLTIRAIRRNRGLVVIAGPLRFAWWLTRVCPGFTEWLMRSGWRRR